MALLDGYLLAVPIGYEADNPAITSDIDTYHAGTFDPGVFDLAQQLQAAVAWVAKVSAPRALGGKVLRSFFNDFYFRIYVNPPAIDLGNIGGEQVREAQIWNAWPYTAHTLTAAEVVDGDGLTVTLPGALPLSFAPLQVRILELTSDVSGGSRIDAHIDLTFTGLDGITIPVTGNRTLPWPLPPDWARGIDESLEWMTDVQQALDGSRSAEPLREAPRREWSFDLLDGRQERRIIENMLYDWTAQVWALPVWTDVELLAAPLALGAEEIPVATAGLDFSVGGQVLLWTDVLHYELAEVASIESAKLVLARPTLQAWPKGARLYPCRQARLQEAPEIRRMSDWVIATRVQFVADEPCDWTAAAPATTYLDIPVLDARGDWTSDPQASFPRQLDVLDGDVGLVNVADYTGYAWQRQSHAWRLYGRAERAAHRGLLYWLAGRAQTLWLPSWADDLELVAATSGAADTLTVAWAAVSLSLRQQPGRRHIRIELNDGRVFYRRVTAAAEVDAERELLSLDTGLGEVIAPGAVRQICWLVLSSLASDRVEIQAAADSHGLADCRVTFAAVPAEEPA